MFIKKLFLVLFSVFCCSTLFSQDWAPPGATWYYSVEGFGVEGYIMIESIGDTMIGSQSYVVLEKSAHTYNFITSSYYDGVIGHEYTYYEDQKVYVWRNNVDYVLYDFSANQGGQWEVPYTYSTGGECDSTGTVMCDATDSIDINGSPHKRLWVNAAAGSNWGFGDLSELVEPIGNITYYLLPNITSECPIADLGEGGSFRCYHDDNLGWYTRVPEAECDFIVGIQEPEETFRFSIYPNPCSIAVRLHVTRPRSRVTNIDLYSISGVWVERLIDKVQMPGEYSIDIDMADLPGGIYYIRVQTGKKVRVGKFLKAGL